MNTLARLYQDARVARGMSLRRLSETAHVSNSAARKLERKGHEGVSLRVVVKIAQELDLDPYAVFAAVKEDIVYDRAARRHT